MISDYDRMLASPPEEKPEHHRVLVTITREYEGDFYGTEDEAERAAHDYYEGHDWDWDEQYITAVIIDDR